MSIAVLVLTLPGLFIIRPGMKEIYLFYLFFILILWLSVELYVGIFRSFENITPSSHRVIRISRMLWPLFCLYSWLDFHFAWTKVDLSFRFILFLLFLCFLGLFFRVWAIITLGRSFSYDVKQPEGGTLVQTGPYRIIRHPGYLAICLLASLPGLILGSIPGFIGMTLSTVIQTILRLQAEDRMLEREFGEKFREYRRRTYGLVPFVY